jgi:ADP-heptose:LPS heptosyltransferase
MDNGVLPLYLSGISKYMIGFSTGGFSFALDTVAPWVAGVHETEHYKVALKEICPDISIQMPRVIYDKQSALSTVLSVTGETHYLVVHIGSREKYKMLDDLKIKQITEWLLENTTKNIVFTGVESESCFFERLQIRSDRIITAFGAFSIFELIECINKSYGVITVDTFAAQIAAMENVPVLSFVSGVPDYRQWHPLGKLVHVMRHNVPCSPCFKPCEGMECMNHDVTDGLKKAFKESFSIYASHEV